MVIPSNLSELGMQKLKKAIGLAPMRSSASMERLALSAMKGLYLIFAEINIA